MPRTLCSRVASIAASAALVVLLATLPAAALEVTVEGWDGPAFPTGAPASANVTVSYNCGDLLPPPVGAEIELEVSLEEGANGTVGQDADTFTPPVPVTECAPEDDPVTHVFNITYTATPEQLEGTTESITVRAVHNASDELADEDEATTSATVGPYVDVSFTPLNETYEATAGDTVTVELQVSSSSNTEISPNAELEVPEAWPEPEVSAPNVASPLEEGSDGTGTITADVTVPEDAEEGDHTITFTVFAQSESEPPLATDSQEIPLTIQVAPAQAEEEDGPAPAVVPVLLGVLLAVVLVRRRRA